MSSLIPASDNLAVMAALFAIAGLGFLGEKTRIGSHLTGAVLAILIAPSTSPDSNLTIPRNVMV